MHTRLFLLLLPPAATWLLALYWLLAPAIFGYYQGQLMPTLRTEPAASPAAVRNSRALHLGFAVFYFLPCLLYAFAPAPLWWLCPVLALLGRIALFDGALNLGAGSPWGYIGQTAASDRIAGRLGRWGQGLKLLCLLGLLALALLAN